MKKLMVLMLTLALLTCVAQAWAEEEQTVHTVDSVTVTMTGDDDADARLQAYIDYLTAGEVTTRPVVGAGNALTGFDAAVYQKLRPLLEEVAAGALESTRFEFTYEELGIQSVFTAQDLGLDYLLDDDGNEHPDLDAAIRNALFPDLNLVVKALLADCPYTLYWYNKSVPGASSVGMLRGYYLSSDRIELVEGAGIVVSMKVANAYASDTYIFDTTKATAVQTAVNNALDVVKLYKDASDYNKLLGYKTYICNAVDYNYDAANGTNVPYGDPWQMIYVFDGDSSTKVVCEGYSKAFQFLCDNTAFDSDITCYSVTGHMNGGGHMWNLVEMPNDKVYMADVTNSDSGSIGSSGGLFLTGYTSVTDGGYIFTAGGEQISYIYDQTALATFNERQLTVSAKAWLSDDQTAVDANYSASDWLYVNDGFAVTITGYIGQGGSVVIPRAIGNIPVTTIASGAFAGSAAATVLVREGVTNIEDGAFANCDSLTAITVESGNEHFAAVNGALYDITGETLIAVPGGAAGFTVPAAVTSIYPSALDGCTSLTAINVTSGNGAFMSANGMLYSIDGATLIRCPAGMEGVAEVPEDAGITAIGSKAFAGCTGLSYIRLPYTVQSIADDAFDGIEDNVTLVVAAGSAAQLFADMHGITWRTDDQVWSEPEYTWNANNSMVTAIRYNLLDPTVYETETEPTMYTVIEDPTCTDNGTGRYVSAIFENTAFGYVTKDIALPALGHNWGDAQYEWAADGSSVTGCILCQRDQSHRIEETVTNIAISMLSEPTFDADGRMMRTADFTASGLEPQHITDTVPRLNEATTLVLPRGVTVIEAEAFANTAFEAVLLPDSLTRIDSGAFAGCSNLRYVGFAAGDSLTTVAADAFDASTACLFAAYDGTFAQAWVTSTGYTLMIVPATAN